MLMKKFDLLSFNNYNSRINNKESIRIRDNYMCNLSQGIREEGLAEGLTKGLEKGVAKGRIDTTLCYVKRLIQKNNFSVTEAMNLLGVDEKIRAVIVMELQQEI